MGLLGTICGDGCGVGVCCDCAVGLLFWYWFTLLLEYIVRCWWRWGGRDVRFPLYNNILAQCCCNSLLFLIYSGQHSSMCVKQNPHFLSILPQQGHPYVALTSDILFVLPNGYWILAERYKRFRSKLTVHNLYFSVVLSSSLDIE